MSGPQQHCPLPELLGATVVLIGHWPPLGASETFHMSITACHSPAQLQSCLEFPTPKWCGPGRAGSSWVPLATASHQCVSLMAALLAPPAAIWWPLSLLNMNCVRKACRRCVQGEHREWTAVGRSPDTHDW
jgi:hypothetical protein